jgi:hypothetical protein
LTWHIPPSATLLKLLEIGNLVLASFVLLAATSVDVANFTIIGMAR